jgi:tRNA pseudouridine55 synthase
VSPRGPGGSSPTSEEAPEGLLLLDKPPGATSHDVVDDVRKALGTRKVGHAGTLDPMATGLLLVGVGRATRLLRFLSGLDKTYEGTFRLGVETDTLDAEGEVVRTAPVTVDEAELRAAMTAAVGETSQRPPAFSAVKVGGRKLYEAARRGESLEAEPRTIRVDAFDLRAFDGRDGGFRAVVSSGTYIRVLVADVGAALGCGAHLIELVRTRIGPFALEDAGDPRSPGSPLTLDRAVAHLPRLELQAEEARVARHGSILGPAGIAGPYVVVDAGGELIGVYEDDGPKARPLVILAPAG